MKTYRLALTFLAACAGGEPTDQPMCAPCPPEAGADGATDAATQRSDGGQAVDSGPGPDAGHRLEGVYVQSTSDLTSAPATFWNNFDGCGANTIIYAGNGWWMNSAGQAPYIAWSEDQVTLATFVQMIKTHNPDIQVYFSSYSDGQTYWEYVNGTNSNAATGTSFPQAASYGDYFYLSQAGTFDGVTYPAGLYQWQFNLADPTFRGQMGSSVAAGLQPLNGTTYGFDGFVDDTEWHNNDAASYLLWTQEITSACHGVDASKMAGIYFGINYPFTDESSVLPYLAVDAANLVWDTNGPHEADNYAAAAHCSVPWYFETRAASTNSDGMNVANCFSYFAGKFEGGIPTLFDGFALWDYPYVSAGEWATLDTSFPLYLKR